ncbi:Uncharacterised protein [Enterobacter kobei]|nr:Uncharacterised protein [Enterobacter kobei]SAF26568.1 Uncharacterised protein [Enterobacter kobei]
MRLRVGTDRFDMTKERIRFDNSSGAVSAYFVLGFLKVHIYTCCRISINQASVYGINDYLVNVLHQLICSLKRPTSFDWLKSINQFTGFDLLLFLFNFSLDLRVNSIS